MNADFAEIESFYMALADKTRLRILDLMRDGEVCVNDLTEILGDSQPKISRHLAYLRQAGVVKTRRDGKWIYYSILQTEDHLRTEVLNGVLNWLVPINGGAFTNSSDKIFISAMPYVSEDEPQEYNHISHNELEEFLL